MKNRREFMSDSVKISGAVGELSLMENSAFGTETKGANQKGML